MWSGLKIVFSIIHISITLKRMHSFILSPRLVGTYHYVRAHHCFPCYKDHISFHLYKAVILLPGSNMDFPLDYHLVETLLFIWSQ